MEQKNHKPEEMITIGILAAFMGGFLDVYTYVLYDGVFANTQTGNLILMSIALFEQEWYKVLLRLVPIGAFFFGVFLFQVISKFYKNYCINLSLIVQIILILIIGFGTLNENSSIICAFISFICALQMVSFKKIRGNIYSTVMCTGNLRSFSEYFSRSIILKNKQDFKTCLIYLLIIFIFCLGVFTGMVLVNLLGVYSILLMLINILAKFLLLCRERRLKS